MCNNYVCACVYTLQNCLVVSYYSCTMFEHLGVKWALQLYPAQTWAVLMECSVYVGCIIALHISIDT